MCNQGKRYGKMVMQNHLDEHDVDHKASSKRMKTSLRFAIKKLLLT